MRFFSKDLGALEVILLALLLLLFMSLLLLLVVLVVLLLVLLLLQLIIFTIIHSDQRLGNIKSTFVGSINISSNVYVLLCFDH